MPEQSSQNIKYTTEDIDRIFAERVKTYLRPATLKPGTLCEWVFEYPNGRLTAQVESAFCISPEHNDYTIGCKVCCGKIKNKLWEICGQYSLITGKKL